MKKDVQFNNGDWADAELATVVDSTGKYAFCPDSLPQTLAYAGPSGALSSVTVGPDTNGFSYKQTLTYTGSNVTAISAWVRQ